MVALTVRLTRPKIRLEYISIWQRRHIIPSNAVWSGNLRNNLGVAADMQIEKPRPVPMAL